MRDLTQGPVTGNLVALALPTAFGMLFQTLYLLVDLYFVAALGEAAVAGVGAAGTLMFVIMAMAQILGVSTVAMMSQAVGRKQPAEANQVFNQSMLLSVGLGVFTLLAGLLCADLYMQGIAADEATHQAGTTFLYFFIPGMALHFGLMCMASALRATGIVKPAMMIQVLTVLLNTILAPILIAGWGPGPALGVMGAGLASSISVSVGVLMLLYYFIKHEKYVKFDLSQWKPDFVVWRKIFHIGLPAGGEMLLMFVYFGLVYVLIQDFGAHAQAGFSVGGRIMQSIFMPTMAIAFAIGPMVGQNFGAGNAGRIRETFHSGLMLGVGVMLVVTIFMQINPYVLVRVFTKDDAVITVAGEFLKLVSLNFVAQGIVFGCSGMFQGLGNTRPAMLSSAFRLLIFIPLAFFVASLDGYEIHDIWYVSILSVWMQAGVSVLLVMRELKIKLNKMSHVSEASMA
jgi:putative MATE family efflux protein